MTTLAEQLERLKPHDVEGWIADAIRDFLRSRFGVCASFSESERMAAGALAALRAGEEQGNG